MKGISYWFVVILPIMSWVSATSRLYPQNDGLDVQQSGPGQKPHQSSQVTLEEELTSSTRTGESRMNEVANYRGGSKIGSSPPSCENKCYGCNPCEAIQVPTTKKNTKYMLEYANYEPEGWKCKCGPSLYSP